MKKKPSGSIFARIAQLAALIEGEITPRKSPPSNPRTYAQMAQRTQLTNIVAIYGLLNSFMKEAWQTVPKKANRYTLFVQHNLNRIKVHLDKDEKAQNAGVVAPYQLSKGTLPPIEWTVANNILVSSLRVPEAFEITDAVTLAEASMVLLQCNKGLLTSGDEITIIHLVQTLNTSAGSNMPHVIPAIYRFTLNHTSEAAFHALIPPALFHATEGRITTGPRLDSGGVAYVIRREEGNKTLISTQSIVLTPDHTLYNEYSSPQKQKQAAESYGSLTQTYFVTPKEE